jgi:hypothetical protein
MVLIVAVVVLLTSLMGAESENIARDKEEIDHVITRAFELIHGGTTKLPEPYCSDSTVRVPEEVEAQVLEQAASDLAEVYSAASPLLEKYILLSEGVVEAQDVEQESERIRDLGGAVLAKRNVSIEVDGDSAVAEADISSWSGIMIKGEEFRPEGVTRCRYTLAREGGVWKITEEEFTNLSQGQ